MNKISEIIAAGKLLVSDGAWGTILFKKGLAIGSCPGEWNLTHRKDVLSIAKSYIESGADIVSTNSFGANLFKLAQFNLDDKLNLICKTSVEISREAAGNKFVMASIGPTGKFLVMDDVTIDDLYNTFKHQATSFEQCGANAACIETFYDLAEAEQAIKAVKENTQLEIICTFTFDKSPDSNFKTLMGITPEQMTESLLSFGADIVGANCGAGFEDMIEIAKKIRSVSTNVPILIQANAGLPILESGNLIYSETPDRIRNIIPHIIDAGANIIGGCCGTTPEHIKVISEIVQQYNLNSQ